MKILLIIPAYNEELNILNVYQQIMEHAPIEVDVMIINDGSTDRTGEILDSSHIPHIDLPTNLGIGGAVQTGYKYALAHDYDIAVQFDGDGQHNIYDLKQLVTPIIKHEADFTIGSRFIDHKGFQSTFSRRLGIGLINRIIRMVTFGKLKVTDSTSGYRAANKSIIAYFASHYPIEYPEPVTLVLLHKQGYTIREVPVVMNERTAGVSSIKSWKNMYYMLNVGLSLLLLVFVKQKERKS